MRWLDHWREKIRPYYLRAVYFRIYPPGRPREFSRCWQVPHEFAGGPPRMDIPPPDPALPDAVFLPMTDWHHRPQRSQQLARGLAAMGRRCFLLNPHLGREYPQSPGSRRAPALGQLEERVFEVHAPLPHEPVFHHRLLTPEESRLVFEALDWALDRCGARQADVIFSLPTWKDAALMLRQRRDAVLVYDCHDRLAGFPNMAREISAAEPEAMRAADAVVFSASALLEQDCAAMPGIRPRAALVRNGVPEWPAPDRPRTQDLVAGYLGALEDWFWTEGVERAARDLPQVRFVLAGRPEPSVRRALGRLPNVDLIGEISHDKAPSLLATFRAGLIPRKGMLPAFMDPLKVYEYFHFGLPVAASRMPELDRFGRLVYQADTPEEFVRAVRLALDENDPALERERREEARAATWKNRAKQLHAVLANARAATGRRLS